MLTLPPFQLLRPTRLDEALDLLRRHRDKARLLAGGTDLLVNMKLGLLAPDLLVDLSGLSGLDRVETRPDGGLRLGAMARLADLADHPQLAERYPVLAQALSQVAGPQLRNMGTLGGNVCLDTRCVYYNQTHFWRQSLGYCLKKDGTECHVVKGGRRCVAAQSSDSAPVLVALGAEARLQSAEGSRQVPVESLYRRDGADHLAIRRDEILTHVRIPPPWPHMKSAYAKLRIRKAIDYPVLSLAVVVGLDDSGLIRRLAVVGTALMATPRRVSGLDRLALGRPLGEAVAEAVAQRAHRQLVPLSNILVDPEWRREMVPVFVRRAFARLRSSTRSPSAGVGGHHE
jgi:4-hydroxybenzoyl-CoA reductase subunit beta